jgi:hypothetical protein
MKASNLIILLKNAIDLHGDLNVKQNLSSEALDANTVGVYLNKEDRTFQLADDYLQEDEDIEEFFTDLRKDGVLIELEIRKE